MIDLKMINETIEELENADTTFFNCQNLAHLYIVRDHYKGASSHDAASVEAELNDILPQYKKYVDIKRKYQMHDTSKEAVLMALEKVCTEIKDFIRELYNNTDMQQERDQIKNLLIQLYKEPL